MKTLTTTLAALLCTASLAAAQEIKFKAQEIDRSLTVGYAVRLLDMNNDGKRDIVVVDSDRVVYFASPDWKLHTLIKDQTKRDNVCFAPHDIDGDGKLDFALGADWRPGDTNNSGSLQWLTGKGKQAGELWGVHQIGQEPTIHRIRWADIDKDGKQELLVVPLFGRGTKGPKWDTAGVRVLAYEVPADPVKDRWPVRVINDELHVCHNFWPVDMDGDGQLEILITSYEGVSILRRNGDGPWSSTLISQGNQQQQRLGASEIKYGKLAGGRDYIATIEPWHGTEAVVYTRDPSDKSKWVRQVVDDQLQWGHAVWCANLDDDPDEELVIGVRDNKNDQIRSGVRVFDPVDGGKTWKRQLVDPAGVAVEDLACADLNGDGRVDIVAVGRATKNVKVYWNEK